MEGRWQEKITEGDNFNWIFLTETSYKNGDWILIRRQIFSCSFLRLGRQSDSISGIQKLLLAAVRTLQFLSLSVGVRRKIFLFPDVWTGPWAGNSWYKTVGSALPCKELQELCWEGTGADHKIFLQSHQRSEPSETTGEFMHLTVKTGEKAELGLKFMSSTLQE